MAGHPNLDLIRRRAGAVLVVGLVAVALGLGAPAATAAPARTLDATLGALWTTVLETPAARNPFGSGGSASACLALDRVVAPFAPPEVGVHSCTVPTGTPIFVVASSNECSTFEGNGTTDAALRACARGNDAQAAPALTVDGVAVAAREAESQLLSIVLPPGNVFGRPAGAAGLSVAHGWVALVHPLTPGTHPIVIGTGPAAIVTTIVVRPGR